MKRPYYRSLAYGLLFSLLSSFILPLQVAKAASFQTTVEATAPSGNAAGQAVKLTTSVTYSGGVVSNALVDIELYNSAAERVYQKVYENQTIGGSATQYILSWMPPTAGTYQVKVGIFSAGWTNLYQWVDRAASFDVTTAPAVAGTTSPTSGAIEMWWPTNGATLSGTQPFKGMLPGQNLAAYKMYWQVDGGQLNLMSDNYTDYPHKESSVDVGGWNWRGAGPYQLNFVAKDLSEKIIGTKSITINVGTASAVSQPTIQPTNQSGQINVIVDTNQGRQAISPFIYGTNFGEKTGVWDGAAHHLALARFGGNRLTTYNWENNASNAGADWQQQNDGYLGGGNTPGEAVRSRVELAHNASAAALVTVPMQGYVAADKNADGDVAATSNYLSTRFRQTLPYKTGSLGQPDLNDGAVYQDEFVSWLEKKFPDATTDSKRKIFYSLDNEPDLWSSSHPRIATKPVTYADLMTKTIAFATAIKNVAPQSLVFGAANYGFNGFQTLQNAADAGGRNFLDFYLDSLRQAEIATGKRVLDVMDVHWYPEAMGGGRRITADDADPAIAEARMQAPRSLWDATYTETSWIADSLHGPIKLLPWLKEKIAQHYPGTKLAITEYYYGGGADISGGIAQADVLGIFGREGVFAANLWHVGATDDRFIYSAFDMFRNFDGKGGAFGDTSVSATNSDSAGASVYASVDSTNANRVTVVAINKTASARSLNLTLTHPTKLTQAAVYQLTSGSAAPQAKGTVPVNSNVLNTNLPAYSVTTFVMTP